MKIFNRSIIARTGLPLGVALAFVLGMAPVNAQDATTDESEVTAETTEVALVPNENANPVATEARGLKDIEVEEGQTRGEAVSAAAQGLGQANGPQRADLSHRTVRPERPARPERPQRPERPTR